MFNIIFSLILTSHFLKFSVKNSVPFRLEASKKIAWRPKSCLATAENFLHLPGRTGPGWKSWNMDETNRFFGTGWGPWGFSTLLSGFLKVCWTTSTTVDSFNKNVRPHSRFFLDVTLNEVVIFQGFHQDFVLRCQFCGWTRNHEIWEKNGAEPSDWFVVFDVKSCGSSSPSLRWEQTKGETINEFHDFWFHLISIHSHKNQLNKLVVQTKNKKLPGECAPFLGTSLLSGYPNDQPLTAHAFQDDLGPATGVAAQIDHHGPPGRWFLLRFFYGFLGFI